jgi:xanthine dehydrogenase accessory factor
MNGFFLEIHEYLATHTSAAVVTLLETRGSVPQQAGARILVGTEGYVSGTIGGGKLEHEAILKAQKLINENSDAENIKPSPVVCLEEWNLDSDLGMSCGGVARLFLKFTTRMSGGYLYSARAIFRRLLFLYWCDWTAMLSVLIRVLSG